MPRAPGLGEYWRLRLARWPRSMPAPATEGYTLLLPVPGDIPVFLELALSVCAFQSDRDRVATLVIPDRMTEAMRTIVAHHRSSWSGPLDLVPLRKPERWYVHLLRSGSRNHGLQLIAGVAATSSSHILLHDADLFLLHRSMLDEQYRSCQERGLACLGVSPVWDPWYAEHGLDLAATWDIVASVEWMRSFPPFEHIGHDALLFGEEHTFDTTLRPQAVTSPALVAHEDRDPDFVHFNYVITTFRNFQRAPDGFVDTDFRLLLISLFEELFANVVRSHLVPTLASMVDGLRTGGGTIRFLSTTDGAAKYAEFRHKLERLLAGPYLPAEPADKARSALAPFDEHYGWPAS